jgi:predicted acylesterase/phospholipase RssA
MFADLVLEGGGVKGIALVGAISVLEERGYEFRRVAGTSAGAIVWSLVAADARAAELEEIMRAVQHPATGPRSPADGPIRSSPAGQIRTAWARRSAKLTLGLG